MIKCLLPLPTAEPWEAMQVGKCSTQILVTCFGSTLAVGFEGWSGTNLPDKWKKKKKESLYKLRKESCGKPNLVEVDGNFLRV